MTHEKDVKRFQILWTLSELSLTILLAILTQGLMPSTSFAYSNMIFSDPISPVPRRKESTPPRMGSPDQSAGEGGFGNSNGGSSMSQSDLAAQVRT